MILPEIKCYLLRVRLEKKKRGWLTPVREIYNSSDVLVYAVTLDIAKEKAKARFVESYPDWIVRSVSSQTII